MRPLLRQFLALLRPHPAASPAATNPLVDELVQLDAQLAAQVRLVCARLDIAATALVRVRAEASPTAADLDASAADPFLRAVDVDWAANPPDAVAVAAGALAAIREVS